MGLSAPRTFAPPGYDIWADTGETDVVKLEEALEDDQRVKDYKGEQGMMDIA